MSGSRFAAHGSAVVCAVQGLSFTVRRMKYKYVFYRSPGNASRITAGFYIKLKEQVCGGPYKTELQAAQAVAKLIGCDVADLARGSKVQRGSSSSSSQRQVGSECVRLIFRSLGGSNPQVQNSNTLCPGQTGHRLRVQVHLSEDGRDERLPIHLLVCKASEKTTAVLH